MGRAHSKGGIHPLFTPVSGMLAQFLSSQAMLQTPTPSAKQTGLTPLSNPSSAKQDSPCHPTPAHLRLSRRFCGLLASLPCFSPPLPGAPRARPHNLLPQTRSCLQPRMQALAIPEPFTCDLAPPRPMCALTLLVWPQLQHQPNQLLCISAPIPRPL